MPSSMRRLPLVMVAVPEPPVKLTLPLRIRRPGATLSELTVRLGLPVPVNARPPEPTVTEALPKPLPSSPWMVLVPPLIFRLP